MTLINADCLEYMKRIDSESIDMIYMDPPFFTQRSHALTARNSAKSYSFDDSWESLEQYLSFLNDRLKECRRILKKTGSIFFHCDKHASHYSRGLLDDVFGPTCFVNEIIWSYKRWSNSRKGLQNSHQNIFFYGKSDSFKYNTLYDDYSVTTNVDQILQERARDNNGKSSYKRNEKGESVIGGPKKGVPLGDVWHIPYLNPKAKERTGYPTQKPVLLLERIIEISTDQNDAVLDPFCGSGTTLVAATLLNRRCIGVDKSPDAITIAKRRLKNPFKTSSALLENGADDYVNKTEFELCILKQLNAVPVQRNGGIDGFLKEGVDGKPVPIKIQTSGETILEARQKLVKAAKMRGCRHMILVKTENDANLFNNELENGNGNILIVDALSFSVLSWMRERVGAGN